MLYKLLGMFVWKGAKMVLRRKYGPTYVPVPLLAGVAVAVLLAVGLAVVKRDSLHDIN
jgi:prepilin signal peptidase PulO-like enzyme (type II secretory pathway)